jgi:putative alpha-1,2-mannosidase
MVCVFGYWFLPGMPGERAVRVGAPLFKKITINLEDGKKLIINAPKNSAENKYVHIMTYNGKPYDLNWVNHLALMQGAVINMDMTAKPNKSRGIKDTDVPFSLSNEK